MIQPRKGRASQHGRPRGRGSRMSCWVKGASHQGADTVGPRFAAVTRAAWAAHGGGTEVAGRRGCVSSSRVGGARWFARRRSEDGGSGDARAPLACGFPRGRGEGGGVRGHPSPPLRWPGGAAPGVASLPPGGQAESPLSSVKEARAAGEPPGRQRGPAEGGPRAHAWLRAPSPRVARLFLWNRRHFCDRHTGRR